MLELHDGRCCTACPKQGAAVKRRRPAIVLEARPQCLHTATPCERFSKSCRGKQLKSRRHPTFAIYLGLCASSQPSAFLAPGKNDDIYQSKFLISRAASNTVWWRVLKASSWEAALARASAAAFALALALAGESRLSIACMLRCAFTFSNVTPASPMVQSPMYLQIVFHMSAPGGPAAVHQTWPLTSPLYTVAQSV